MRCSHHHDDPGWPRGGFAPVATLENLSLDLRIVKKRSHMTHTSEAFVLGLVLLMLGFQPAQSAEGGFYSGPIGGSDVGSALLGTPGSLSFTPSEVSQFTTLFTGPNGKPAPGARSVAFFAQGFSGTLSYTYPWTLYGGEFGSKIQGQYAFAYYRLNSEGQHTSGVTDPFVDLLIYSKHLGLFGAVPPKEGDGHLHLPYGLTIAPAFSMAVPLDRYNVRDINNQGHNANIFVPNIALSYVTGPNLSFFDSTGIDMRFYYEMSADNPKTGYRDGDTFVSDFAITQRIQDVQFGITGTVAKATNSDTLHHVERPVDGNRLFDFLIGPIVSVSVPKWGATFALKGLYDADSHNRLDHNLVLLRASVTLF